jgi:L-lactate dehydrogenase complex protein LldG
MQDSTPKEKMLKKIRKALIQKAKNPYPALDLDSNIYAVNDDESPEINFAQQLMAAGGRFLFCENEYEFAENLISLAHELKLKNFFCREHKIKALLKDCEFPFKDAEEDLLSADVAVTLCEALVARTGSIIMSSKQLSGRTLISYAPVHIVLAYTSQLVPDMKDALLLMKNRYEDALPSMITAITGPSRTADIEKTLVMGAHGPKELYVFLIDQ